MKLSMTVHYEDGTTQDVTARFADFVAFERTWQRSVTRFESELRLTDLGWLAWSALTRAKKTTLKFDPDWTESVANVVMAESTEGDTPLTNNQPTG